MYSHGWDNMAFKILVDYLPCLAYMMSWNWPRKQLRDAGWPPSHIVRLRKVTHPLETEPSAASSMIVRRDITPVNPTKRGKIQSAIIASYGTHRKRTHDELTRDFYAPSCHDSRQSNWKTWCTIAEAWGLLPIPDYRWTCLSCRGITQERWLQIIQKLLQSGNARHRDHCINPLPDSTLALITRVTRSINQGIGPTTFKDSLELELFPYTTACWRERSRSVVPTHRNSQGHYRNLLLVAPEGIEAAGAKMHQFGDKPPAQPTPPTSRYRSRRTTQQACVSAEATTVCANGTTQTQFAHTVRWFDMRNESALCSRDQTQCLLYQNQTATPGQQTIIDIFRRAIEYTGTQLQRPGPDGRGIHRFSEHVCRVSGAQFLTRLGYNIDAVQLIGRWGSDAMKRYIQDSPLMRPQQVTQISTEEHIRQLVKDQMTRSYNQFWIVHSTSGICHIPAIAENCIDNRRWHTVCGWYYGSSTFKKSFNKPTKDRCLKCFRYTEITDVQEIDLSESDDDQ